MNIQSRVKSDSNAAVKMKITASQGAMLYEGKAKKIFAVNENPNWVWIEYKNSLTAFNAQKTGSFEGKGSLNAQITVILFELLSSKGIPTHLKQALSPTEILCEKVEIIPLEVVVRNRLAGSTAKKLGLEEGSLLSRPLVEFYFKDDALGDPFVSEEQVAVLGLTKKAEDTKVTKELALQINEILKSVFKEVGLELIDFKLEFGRNKEGQVILADEVTPDTCRLWDLVTKERMDKDRFRRDLGRVQESYQEVFERLKAKWGSFL